MKLDKAKVLIVDDKPENLYALSKLLKNLEVEVYQALSGPEALNLVLAHDFCVAVVDIQMPGMDGYELVELLRSNEGTATLPVIFVSAIFSDEYHHRKGYEAGAVDFMSKPFTPQILLSKIKIFMDLYQQRRAVQQANVVLAKRAIQLSSPFNLCLATTLSASGS
jgi:CheY-like chemotaxis protein